MKAGSARQLGITQETDVLFLDEGDIHGNPGGIFRFRTVLIFRSRFRADKDTWLITHVSRGRCSKGSWFNGKRFRNLLDQSLRSV